MVEVCIAQSSGFQSSGPITPCASGQPLSLASGFWYSGPFRMGHVLRDNERARFALVVMQLPCVAADGYALTHAGRRLSSAASMLTLSIATSTLSAVNVLGAPDQLDVIVAVSGLQVQDISAIAAFAFSAELYLTELRGSALSCCYKSGSTGAFAASFVNAVRSPPLRALFAPRRPPCHSSGL
ncbi:hypothetical protein MRX96_022582 [Rhipicephalus microplus]